MYIQEIAKGRRGVTRRARRDSKDIRLGLKRIRGAVDSADVTDLFEPWVRQLDRAGVEKVREQLEQVLDDACQPDLWGALQVLCPDEPQTQFNGFRIWLAAQGRMTFDSVLGEPELLSEVLDDSDVPDFQAFDEVLTILDEAFEEKTGSAPPPFYFSTIEDFSDETGWETMDDEEAQEKFPSLWESRR